MPPLSEALRSSKTDASLGKFICRSKPNRRRLRRSSRVMLKVVVVSAAKRAGQGSPSTIAPLQLRHLGKPTEGCQATQFPACRGRSRKASTQAFRWCQTLERRVGGTHSEHI